MVKSCRGGRKRRHVVPHRLDLRGHGAAARPARRVLAFHAGEGKHIEPGGREVRAGRERLRRGDGGNYFSIVKIPGSFSATCVAAVSKLSLKIAKIMQDLSSAVTQNSVRFNARLHGLRSRADEQNITDRYRLSNLASKPRDDKDDDMRTCVADRIDNIDASCTWTNFSHTTIRSCLHSHTANTKTAASLPGLVVPDLLHVVLEGAVEAAQVGRGERVERHAPVF